MLESDAVIYLKQVNGKQVEEIRNLRKQAHDESERYREIIREYIEDYGSEIAHNHHQCDDVCELDDPCEDFRLGHF